jgi:Ran GTPase-activating protein (RanGAP) involved in mRNA processing and transport
VCDIEDDGFVALVSALEQSTSLQIIMLKDNAFGERGFMALAKELSHNQRIAANRLQGVCELSIDQAVIDGGLSKKNTSLLEVRIEISGCANWELGIGHRN